MTTHKEGDHSPVEFLDVSFAYPADAYPAEGEISGQEPEKSGGMEQEPVPVFSGLTMKLPSGFVFMVGPNGIGKSTLMLLAAARLFPAKGEIRIYGESTLQFVDAALEPDVEERRNRLVSFVYQNMEFETELSLGDILEMVARNSVDESAAGDRFREIIAAADLTDRLTARMQELSKGEMQRGIVAMSLLYGSPIVMMDEPVFAVEPHRAEKLFEYLRAVCRERGLAIYTSVHDVRLAQQFADKVVLMHTDGLIEAGDPAVLLARDRLEQAFKAPWDTLYRRQSLYRDLLNSGAVEEPDG
jgi:ABC-type multidrug transport system ATPase subunit